MVRMPRRQLPSSRAAAQGHSLAEWSASSARSRLLKMLAFAAVVAACASATPGRAPSSAADSGGAHAVEPLRSGAADRAVRAAVLERDGFVRGVLERNPTLEAARQGLRAAEARARQAGAFEEPLLELGIAPLSVAPSRAPLGVEVGISQRLPWFGKRALEREATAAEADAAKSDYEAVERELGLTAVLLYDDYFVAARSLAINAEHVALLRVMHDSAVAQFGAGRGSAQDALQAEVELTHMEHDAVVLTSERDVTLAQMNELLHRAPDLPLPPPPEELTLPADPDEGSDASFAVARRPDVVAAEQRARAEQARAERAERDAYPDVTLSTSYNSMWDMPQHRWMVGVGFNLPIQTGRRAAAADEARAMRAQFLSAAARLTDAARTEVFVAVTRLREARHVLELLETRLLPVARAQIDAARAGFVTSQNAFTAVVEAERNLRGVELEYQTTRAEYGKRRAELDRALGRIPGLDWKEGSN